MNEDILNKSEIIFKKLNETGLKYSATQEFSRLTCLKECGKCCFNPEVYARPLELLPLALDLLRTNRLEETYEALVQYTYSSDDKVPCYFYKKIDDLKGYCIAYEFRPLLCRSFGAFLRNKRDKDKELSVCKLIKSEKTEAYTNALKNINEIPEEYCTELLANSFYQVDPELFLEQELQINHAALIVFKKVIFYSHLYKK